jgi:putative membrane protein
MLDWRHWHNEPYLVGGLIFVGWLYALATGPWRGRLAPEGTLYPRRQAVCFYAALVIFYLAVGSPLDQAGERFLLSAHMVQHQLLIYPAAILWLRGMPAWCAERLVRALGGLRLWRAMTHPVSCALGYTLTLSAWHAPALYDWALQNKYVHVLEHVMFFGGALLYWWPLLSPAPSLPPLKTPLRMLYLVAVTILMTPLFAFLAFSQDVLYPTYEFAPRLFADFDAQEDQLLGAAIMKLGGMAVTFVALMWCFYHWYQESEGRSRGAR